MRDPERPLLVYDGDCAFCRAWIARWRRVIGERIEYAPFQEAAARLPEIPREDLAHAVHLIEPDGRRSRAAEAVFRSLAYAPGQGWGLLLYRFLPGFAPASEAVYRLIASHRPGCDRLTVVVWGPHVVPPGETLTAWIFLRVLGVTFLLAFASVWVQIVGLVGSEGILPTRDYLEAVRAQVGTAGYWLAPTLAWLAAGDSALHAMCAAGIFASLLLVVGLVPVASLLACWALYLSLVTVGREFFWFQWDALLLETGFLGLFLAPLRLRSHPASDPPPSRLALWALRGLLFRLSFSSAVVKLASGDASWRSLTALEFHYETQCLPPWTAWFMHQLPAWFHQLSALMMFAIEGLVPFLILAPRRVRFAAAGAMAALQVLIALSGNYGFFNLLAAALCLLLLDDGVWPWRWRTARKAALAARLAGGLPGAGTERGAERPGRWPVWVLRPAVGLLLLASLVPLASALRLPPGGLGPLVPLYRMFSPPRLVNRYGLFATMTTRRPEIVIEASADGTTWREYGFRWKPGDPRRRPAFVAPHMPRLDWRMWFAALDPDWRQPWFLAFCRRLLQRSPPVMALLEEDPLAGRRPRYVRAWLYDYRFADSRARRATGAWWHRTLTGPYGPVLTLEEGRLRAVAGDPPGR